MSKGGDKRWWVSWHQPIQDYRPNYKGGDNSTVMDVEPKILGWWCSGENMSGEAILCALMLGKSEGHVNNLIRKYWPEARLDPSRFMRQVDDDWIPGDRFPLRGVSEL